jgi:osmotically inducible protein OsmC
MKRSASAIWSGDLKTGHGALATHSGVLKETPYSFATRFESAPGTNPEELIAAAHAGCFTMALSASLGKAGFTPKRLATQATVSLELVNGNFTITAVALENEAWVPGISADQFEQIAADAKANCPVSRLLKADISLKAKLEAGS